MLEKHYEFCSVGKTQIECMPKTNKYSFSNYFNQLRLLMVIYSDTEALITPNNRILRPIAIAAYHVWHPHYVARQRNEEVKTWARRK